MSRHILTNQTPETKRYGYHISLFLWFSNLTLGQCKFSYLPARSLYDPSLMGLGGWGGIALGIPFRI